MHRLNEAMCVADPLGPNSAAGHRHFDFFFVPQGSGSLDPLYFLSRVHKHETWDEMETIKATSSCLTEHDERLCKVFKPD